jgi:PIN domain nuclease of toxin-antitoxin system
MNWLLDTHIVLWWLTDDATLSDEIKAVLDREAAVYISAATIWEVTIKQARGKIIGPVDLAEQISDKGFRELRINFQHAKIAGRLPPIHNDPFDRMLVAQAQCEGLTLVTRDTNCQRYEVDILPA